MTGCRTGLPPCRNIQPPANRLRVTVTQAHRVTRRGSTRLRLNTVILAATSTPTPAETSNVRKHLQNFAQLTRAGIHSLPLGPSTTSGTKKGSSADDAPDKRPRMSKNAAVASTFPHVLGAAHRNAGRPCTRCLLRLHTPMIKVPGTPSSTDRCACLHWLSKPREPAAKRTRDRNAKRESTDAERGACDTSSW